MKRAANPRFVHWLRAQLIVSCLALMPFFAHGINWPQEVDAEEGTIVVYQPQPESLKGNILTSRSAMSLELNKPATTGSQNAVDADVRQQAQQREKKMTPEQRQSAANKNQQRQQSGHQQTPQRQDYNRAYNARQAGASRERICTVAGVVTAEAVVAEVVAGSLVESIFVSTPEQAAQRGEDKSGAGGFLPGVFVGDRFNALPRGHSGGHTRALKLLW